MKNLFKCSSLIRVAVVIVVVAFMASQMTATYAKGRSDDDSDSCDDKVLKMEITNWDENPCCEAQSSPTLPMGVGVIQAGATITIYKAYGGNTNVTVTVSI